MTPRLVRRLLIRGAAVVLISLPLFVVQCRSGERRFGPAASAKQVERPVTSIDFVTSGSGMAYGQALDRIAFFRFDSNIIGGPNLAGQNDNTGTFQLWTADPDGNNENCLSCRDVPGGPRLNQHKGIPTWHPSGRWIVAAVEMPIHGAPHARAVAGAGAYNDLWAISPDGAQWVQLTHYANVARRTRFEDAPVGALAPRLSRRGDTLVWAEMIGYDARHPFGIWRLAKSDFVEDGRGPRLENQVSSTPGTAGTSFYEPRGFSPDDRFVTVASDSGQASPGFMDVQLWDHVAGTLSNLTLSDDQYEEQAEFSPDGTLVAFMSTRDQDPPYVARRFLATLRTDVWLMRADGSDPVRLTYFNNPEYSEYLPGQNVVVPTDWSPDGTMVYVDVSQIVNDVPSREHSVYRLTLRR